MAPMLAKLIVAELSPFLWLWSFAFEVFFEQCGPDQLKQPDVARSPFEERFFP
jgi:hypothetical protein